MTATVVEKILARCADRNSVTAGESISVRPDSMLAYEMPGFTDRLFDRMREQFNITALSEPDRYVMFIDHLLTRGNARESSAHKTTREWAQAMGAHLHEGVGIGHQAAAELGYAQPGRFVIHFDAHVAGLGAYGALALGLHRYLFEGWLTGQVTLVVPPTSRLMLSGRLTPGVEGRDVVHNLIRTHGASGFLNTVIEFDGPGARTLSLDQRQTLCNMAVFTGALSAIFSADELSTSYAEAIFARTGRAYEVVRSDPGARFQRTLDVALDQIEPQIVLPGSTKAANTVPVGQVAGERIDRAFIGSCASGRLDDLRAAAAILDGRRVASHVRLKVVASSSAVWRQAEAEGTLEVLRQAGAQVGEMSSCDSCFGYDDPLLDGEKCVSTGALNLAGRMGAPSASIYMSSASTVAASAVAGRLTDPRGLGGSGGAP